MTACRGVPLARRSGLIVGDRILFGKYSGSEVKMNGQEFVILREDEALGIIETAEAERKAV